MFSCRSPATRPLTRSSRSNGTDVTDAVHRERRRPARSRHRPRRRQEHDRGEGRRRHRRLDGDEPLEERSDVLGSAHQAVGLHDRGGRPGCRDRRRLRRADRHDVVVQARRTGRRSLSPTRPTIPADVGDDHGRRRDRAVRHPHRARRDRPRHLHDLVARPDARRPATWDPAGWNDRLVYRFGGGCGTQYSQGVARSRAAPTPTCSAAATPSRRTRSTRSRPRATRRCRPRPR